MQVSAREKQRRRQAKYNLSVKVQRNPDNLYGNHNLIKAIISALKNMYPWDHPDYHAMLEIVADLAQSRNLPRPLILTLLGAFKLPWDNPVEYRERAFRRLGPAAAAAAASTANGEDAGAVAEAAENAFFNADDTTDDTTDAAADAFFTADVEKNTRAFLDLQLSPSKAAASKGMTCYF
jgi:hypothetical protein